jgi:mannose-6-phosphate isomerase-like protein (cupin superfamily)
MFLRPTSDGHHENAFDSSTEREQMIGETTAHFSIENAMSRLPGPYDAGSVALFAHGTLLVKLYAPRGHDPQTPHTRDEVYVVMRGTGTFFNGETRKPFSPGDFLFVEAGVPHRFEDFSPDFATWVMYLGPEGGELASPQQAG